MSKLPRDLPQDICAYCGSSENLTRDHVPPKNLFPRPRPSNLIEVRACKICHSDTSKDDEYFRLKICLRDGVGKHPAARTQWNTIFRSLKRSKARGLARQFLSDIHLVQLKTPSGLYLGKRLGYNVDMNRIRRVVQRTIRGLYFVESRKPLGLNNEVRIYTEEDIKELPQDVRDQLIQTILTPLVTYPSKVVGNSIFLYRHHIAKENPVFSVWGISFYGQVPFLAMTGPRSLVCT
jgi:hypothetical protein